MAREFDPEAATFGAPEQAIAHGVAPTLYLQGAFSASRDGTLAYSSGEANDARALVWVTESGTPDREIRVRGVRRDIHRHGAGDEGRGIA